MTGLEKNGREGKIYNVAEIKKLFLKGVSDIVGKSIEFPKWFDADEKGISVEPDPAMATKVHAPKMATISDHYDPKLVCSSSGFNVGTMVVEKGVETTPESIYVIFIIDENVVHTKLVPLLVLQIEAEKTLEYPWELAAAASSIDGQLSVRLGLKLTGWETS